jgi:hypothetical protein
LLAGKYLFKGKDMKEISRNNKKCDLSKLDNELDYISPKGKDLLLKLLDPD